MRIEWDNDRSRERQLAEFFARFALAMVGGPKQLLEATVLCDQLQQVIISEKSSSERIEVSLSALALALSALILSLSEDETDAEKLAAAQSVTRSIQ